MSLVIRIRITSTNRTTGLTKRVNSCDELNVTYLWMLSVWSVLGKRIHDTLIFFNEKLKISPRWMRENVNFLNRLSDFDKNVLLYII